LDRPIAGLRHTAARIAHLTSVHPPLDHRIFSKECRTLVEAGFDVTLIAPADEDSDVEGVKIRAVRPSANRVERMSRTIWSVYRAAVHERADLYHFHDPELIPVGILLKLRGNRVVFDVHEDDPQQILSKSWLPKAVRPLIAWGLNVIEGTAARLFDATVLVIPMRHRKFPRLKTLLVRNFPLLQEFSPRSGIPYAERPPLATYVGDVSVVRGAYEMMAAMALLPQDVEARLAIAGRFRPPELANALQALPGADRVDLIGLVPRDRVAALLGEARIGLCILHPIPGFPEAYPVKLFEYMAAGIPIISSDFPVWRRVVDRAGCGLLVDPLQPAELADAIATLLRDPEAARAMGERGRKAVIENYRWQAEGLRMVALYRRLLGA